MIQGFIPGPRDFAAYVYKIRYFVYAIALLMLLSFLIGAVFAATMPDETDEDRQPRRQHRWETSIRTPRSA